MVEFLRGVGGAEYIAVMTDLRADLLALGMPHGMVRDFCNDVHNRGKDDTVNLLRERTGMPSFGTDDQHRDNAAELGSSV